MNKNHSLQRTKFIRSKHSVLPQRRLRSKQLALTWNDHLNFVLLDNCSLQGIRFQEKLEGYEEMEAETALQQFHADFLIMTKTFGDLFDELSDFFLSGANIKYWLIISITINKAIYFTFSAPSGNGTLLRGQLALPATLNHRNSGRVVLLCSFVYP